MEEDGIITALQEVIIQHKKRLQRYTGNNSIKPTDETFTP